MSKKFYLLEKFNQKGIVRSGERVRLQLLNLIALYNIVGPSLNLRPVPSRRSVPFLEGCP